MNVIVIILDSLRKDHVGCYGNQWIKTPNIDKLAEESVIFTRAFPESLPTIPVRRALHTGIRVFPCRDYRGRKGDVVRIPGWEPIPEEHVTMSEIFRHHGYRTAFYTSTYHMFKPSMNFHRGFDCWEWIRGHEADPYRLKIEGDVEDPRLLKSELAYGCVGHSLAYCLPNMMDWEKEEDWITPRTFGKAIEWLERYHKRGPFLLMVDEFDPHEPWNAPRDILSLYMDLESYSGRRIINTHGGPYKFREGELEYTKAQYAGEVTLCDKYIGKLLEKVKELGLWDDTIIVLASDHGHNIMDHGVMHKVPSHLYPELMDLVLIIRHPDGEFVGERCDAYVGHHDILPTLLSFTGLESPLKLDGENLWDWVTGEREDRREYATSIFGDWVWCRDEEYAYISNLNGDYAKLYDLKRDPEQRVNIASERPDICELMYSRILKDAGGSLPHYYLGREGHEWYELPDIFAPGARKPSLEHYKPEEGA